jgi:menaquinone-dependent protoporphyrinogen oxidase
MRVLVAFASRHGATTGIAERIRSVLADQGLAVDVHTVTDARIMERGSHLERYDAFVIGSAMYMFHWLPDARDFIRRNAHLLITRPVWLFASGPLGDKTVDAQGRDFLKPPPEMADLADRVAAVGSRIFFGAYDPTAKPIGVMERFLSIAPAGRNALPAGDFRNWGEIEAWAQSIAHELTAVAVPA